MLRSRNLDVSRVKAFPRVCWVETSVPVIHGHYAASSGPISEQRQGRIGAYNERSTFEFSVEYLIPTLNRLRT